MTILVHSRAQNGTKGNECEWEHQLMQSVKRLGDRGIKPLQ